MVCWGSPARCWYSCWPQLSSSSTATGKVECGTGDMGHADDGGGDDYDDTKDHGG